MTRLLGLCTFALLCLPVRAFADEKPAPSTPASEPAREPSKADVKKADALFQKAVSLKKQGKMAEACPLFEESQRLDPNGGTLVNIAECHEAEGKTGTAWRELLEAYRLARQTENKEIIAWTRRQLQEIVPKLHQLTVLIPAETSALPGVSVHLDGQPLKVQVPSHFVVMDPGIHTITASAPGHLDYHEQVRLISPGHKITLSVTLEKPPPPPDYRPSWILFGVGAAGVATGAAFLGIGLANGSDGGFLGGAAGAGALGITSFILGGILWPAPPAATPPVTLRSPTVHVSATPLLGPTVAGLAVTGAF